MSSESSPPMLRLDDVEVHFEDEGILDSLLGREPETVAAVDGVSLDIGENEVVALVGESGCGKTTLGKTAIGLERPTGGTIEYRGQDIWTAHDGVGRIDIPYHEIREALQIIHQDPGSSLNPNQTVETALSKPLERHRPDMSPDRRELTARRVLERVGMKPADDYATRFPHQLSGGEKQRVALGRALLMEPDFILADEAVSALDVSLRVEMMDLMLELQDEFNTSYLFISHDFSNARYLAEKAGGRIGIMYLGKLVEIGPVEEVLQNPKHPYTKVLTWATPAIDPRKAREEADAQPPVRSIDIPTPDDPPSGCNFHTRCEQIIPPEDVDLSQEAYNALMNLRGDIADRSLDVDRVRQSLEGDDASVDADRLVEALRERELTVDLDEPHGARVDEALEAVVDDEWERAATLLREHYESECERVEPELGERDHPAACFLYDEGTVQVEADAD